MIFIYLFWICVCIVLYNYIGYTIILYILVIIKRIFKKRLQFKDDFLPELTLLIPAYNELEYIDAKIKNTNNLNYPKNKLKVIWITDGSDDGSVEKLSEFNDITVLHENERKGKIGAVNRAMKIIKTPFVVYCDANAMLNQNCLTEIVQPFRNKNVGCVTGEKKIIKRKSDKAVSTGEGSYWNYESVIKMLESEIGSTVGAAGELFAIRTELYEEIPADSIIEDFIISLMTIRKKYKNKYAPKAFSEENASLNISEEMKRKVRIAYGCVQTFFRNLDVLNPFKFGLFAWQYFSHKVLRWMFVPCAIPIILFLNIYIYLSHNMNILYEYILYLQFGFYLVTLLGLIFKNKKIRLGIFFIPFYLIVMNISIIKGYFRYFTSKQSATWEKSKRST